MPAVRIVDVVPLVQGTALGMMPVNVPAAFLGDKIALQVTMKRVHDIAPATLAVLRAPALRHAG